MLRRAPATEPGIVGRVEDEIRAVGPVDHFAREDDLVTYLQTDLAPGAGQLDGLRARPVGGVALARRELRETDRRQNRSHRQILAVRNEMGLVVAAEDMTRRIQR